MCERIFFFRYVGDNLCYRIVSMLPIGYAYPGYDPSALMSGPPVPFVGPVRTSPTPKRSKSPNAEERRRKKADADAQKARKQADAEAERERKRSAADADRTRKQADAEAERERKRDAEAERERKRSTADAERALKKAHEYRAEMLAQPGANQSQQAQAETANLFLFGGPAASAAVGLARMRELRALFAAESISEAGKVLLSLLLVHTAAAMAAAGG